MAFNECPECGETNYAEDLSNFRSFTCGFQAYPRRRFAVCKQPSAKRIGVERIVNDTSSRYRLALLDAAQAADAVAADMEADGCEVIYIERCRELARQMRDFAGHGSGFEKGRDKAASKGSAIIAFFRKDKRST
jgi:hypothetical protein